MITQQQITQAKLLIVDDEHSNILVLQRILERAGYKETRSTTDPRMVLSMYQEYPPDLILLDLNMPHLDGFVVMKQLQEVEQDSYLSVLILTSMADQAVRVRALNAGAKDFLIKPFDQAEVLARIRNLLEVRLLYNALRDQSQILEEKVHKRTREIQETQLDIIRRLGRAAEYRDDQTGTHIVRVSLYAALLGHAAGMDEEECQLLLHASPMHDVGKIGIPDQILLKPGELESTEWETMKSHVKIGAQLLSGSRSKLMQMAERIVLTHQERWDGSGYPKGLKGDEIPLEGRICTLCDVFDALTSDRPYKNAWTIDEAVSEIERNSGKQFDPKLVDLFKRLLPEIIAIKEYFSESPVPG